jgi:hypothetical protein
MLPEMFRETEKQTGERTENFLVIIHRETLHHIPRESPGEYHQNLIKNLMAGLIGYS